MKSNQYQSILSWLEQQSHEMTQLVIDWAMINSGSYHLVGLMRMQQTLSDAFACLEGQQEIIACPSFKATTLSGEIEAISPGNLLRIYKRPTAQHQILLTGHMDTVFGLDHPFQNVNRLDSNTLNGPGVADMKGGLVVMLYALLALERSPFADNLGWEIIINADEEIGSLGSAPLLKQYAQHHKMGLVFEPALDVTGTLASARKGSGKFTIVMKGKAAHAGRAFHEGHNAISALAEVIVRLHQLNDQREGVTLNVGLVQGGHALNVVPDKAVCQIDVRTTMVEDQHWLEAQFKKLQDEFNQLTGYHMEISGSFNRHPKIFNPKTEHLFKLLKTLGEQLSIPVQWQPTGGCCDGNNLAAMGLSVIDSLGVRGGAIHSENEFIILESLVERAKLTALLLMTIANNEVETQEFEPLR